MNPEPPVPTRRAQERDLLGKPSPKGTWDHRRGEPRGLAVAWGVYLVLCSSSMYVAAASPGHALETYCWSARIMLTTVMIGAVVLWPMVRLCQQIPTRICGAVGLDMLVIIGLAQAVVLPQGWFGGWSVRVVAALDVVLVQWVVIAGGVAALSMRFARVSGSRWWRVGGMFAVLLVSFGGSVLALLNSGDRDWGGRAIDLCSAVGAVWAVTGDASTLPGFGASRTGLALVGGFAAVLWVLALVACGRGTGRAVH